MRQNLMCPVPAGTPSSSVLLLLAERLHFSVLRDLHEQHYVPCGQCMPALLKHACKPVAHHSSRHI